MGRGNLDRYAGFANELADTARELLLSMSGKGMQTVYKEDDSPVTNQDKIIERALRQRIEESFPDHGIYGEEFGSSNTDSEFVWVLDPIDGTSSFVAGLPNYCTLIGLCVEGLPVLGLIENVVTKSRWFGVDGTNSSMNGIPIRTRPCNGLANSLITTYSPDMFRIGEREVLKELVSRTRLTVYGGNSFAYGRLAQGMIDLGIECQHDVTDYTALVPIIKNAGGIVSDWEGHPLSISSGDRFIATGDPGLHTEACELLSEFSRVGVGSD